ncbi:PREDICTED: 4-hydroxy-2-oxoglutarate aldolase, mitochondrial-like [Priapulus caudatus]|uniref:4-hydroxy-2-oxoglutarate aldolase, mitochondrial n=1 Tax=Priapulus caudatus TaxID=37621 RepID=A0ABM1E5N8_PRICU|nr:PREDICTED: 4-hydroxy-2-oxoglutarate aldolase, mitochondrial-like [Priapulus caudatus]
MNSVIRGVSIYRLLRRAFAPVATVRCHIQGRKCDTSAGVTLGGTISRRVSTDSDTEQLDLSGIFPPIVTPFKKNEDLHLVKLKENLQKWNKINFKGYVVLGSNGEAVHLTPEERVDVVKCVRDNSARGKLLLAGAGCESTRETIEMSKRVADAGADAVLVITPSFFKAKMNNVAIIDHFTKVADASPVPLILYNMPANTVVDMSVDAVIQLSEHPNIIGFKDSGGDLAKLGYIVLKTKDNGFQVLAGSAGFLLPSYVIGCVGGICAVANIVGQTVCDVHSLYHKGDMETALQLQQMLIGPNTAVTKTFGVSGLKAAMEWVGLYGGPARAPLQPLTAEERIALRRAFLASELIKDNL